MNLSRYQDESPPGRLTLPGGAVMLSVPMPDAQSVALGVWVSKGTQDEPPGLGGLSHFLEHIVFKGSTSRSAYDLALAFDGIGASVDAFTTKDHFAFTVRVLPEYLPTAVELLADMLLRPAFDPEMIALEQEVICEEIQEAADTPEDRLHDAFAARVYGTHPRSLPILGTRESVMALDAVVLRREHARLFAGPNLVIALAGALGPDTGDVVARGFDAAVTPAAPSPSRGTAASVPAARVARGVGALGSDGAVAGVGAVGGVGSDAVAQAPQATPREADRLELRSQILQSYFEIGNLACSYRHPDRIPIFMLTNLLGGGMSSRVFQAVREREGLAYTIYHYFDMGRDTGLVSCAGSCSPNKAARLEEVVRAEYGRLIRDGIPEAELENNRAQIKSQMIFSLEGVVNQMSVAVKNELYYGGFVPVRELLAQIDNLDRDTVVRCAREYFDPERLIVATHGPV
jgi:predicted Zn-dependent peptidase